MITCDSSKLLNDLKDFHKEATRRLKSMVMDFSSTVTSVVIDKTPLGSAEVYPKFYDKRLTDPAWQSYGLQPVEGFAKGSWRISTDGSINVQELYTSGSGDVALGLADDAVENYKLGDTVTISNKGPYIDKLESNYSEQTNGEGIMQPTVNEILFIHQLDLADYYKNSF